MALVLTIENETALADGGPLTYSVEGKRGFDIGRDAHLDWTLPDPSRYISSRHCEVRYSDGAYWLHDVSTNGTYLNGSERRMSEPHRLRNGDRIAIGHYLIAVALTGETDERPADLGRPPVAARPARAMSPDLWTGDTPPPSPARDALAARSRPISTPPPGGGDFMDWAADPPPLQANAGNDRPLAGDASQRALSPAPPNPHRLRDLLPVDEGWWDASPAATQPSPQATPPPQQKATPVVGQATGLESATPFSVRAASPSLETAPASAQAPPQSITPPASAVTGPTSASADGAQFMRAFAEAAGMNPADLAHHDPESFARLLGGLVRHTTDELKQLLEARFEAKRMARSCQQTQITGADNNPLKFAPTVDDALRLMLGPPTRGYLGATRAVQSSFKDVKTHQLETYAAMQSALLELAEEFDPKHIDASLGRDGGIGNLVSSRKARLWDVFVARWEARTLRADNGILGAFMEYFSKHYDREK